MPTYDYQMSDRYYIPDEKDNVQLLPLIQMIARVSRAAMATELAGTGLYPGQEGVLEVLANDGPTSPSDIAARLGVRPPTITKTLTRLEAQQFIERMKSDTDGREVVVVLTPKGEKIVKVIKKALKRAEKKVLSGLKKKDRKQLLAILADMARSLAYETGI